MHAHKHHKHKKSISDRVAEEAINEIMMAGLAFLLVVAGINYFNMKWSWTKIISEAGAATGVSQTAAGVEVTSMLSALANTFPFKFLFAQHDFFGALVIAIVLTTIGIALKAFTVKTKGKFVIDIGRNIYIPAFIGLFVIVILQLWTAFNVDDYIRTHAMIRPEFTSGYFIWQTYGQLFLLGAALLVIGAIIKLVGEKNRMKKLMLAGNVMFKGSFILIVYYFIIRIMAIDTIIQSSAGEILKLFIISNQYSNFSIIVCIFMFAFGMELKRYGIAMLRHEKKMCQLEEVKEKYSSLIQEHGAKLIPRPKTEHPKKLHVEEHHLKKHPAYSIPEHPIHRYVQPKEQYRKEGK